MRSILDSIFFSLNNFCIFGPIPFVLEIGLKKKLKFFSII